MGDEIITDIFRYFTMIPHNFGRGVLPIIDNQNSLDSEIKLLDSLSDLQVELSLENSLKFQIGRKKLACSKGCK